MIRRQTLLVVEDDADLRRLLKTTLILAGFDVQEAGDGLDALRSLDLHPPDGVVLDLGLPYISGRIVRDEIAAHAHTRDIPVIVVTGETGPLGDLQAACVLRKPIDPERLLDIVRRCVSLRGGAGASFGR